MAIVPVPHGGSLGTTAVIAAVIAIYMGWSHGVDWPTSATEAEKARYILADNVFKWGLSAAGGVMLGGALLRQSSRHGTALIAVGELLGAVAFAAIAIETYTESRAFDGYMLITGLLSFLAFYGAKDAWRIYTAESAAASGRGAEPGADV